ncbi:MAG TPA: ABC transporter permease [Chthonomonadaceae bacterium]|nr:ABC transporter permease [Chthonomonadaceae bacterium]
MQATLKSTPMVDELRELWKFRDLLSQLVKRELKVRYKNSVLGFVWSIVPPLLQVMVYAFFIKQLMNANAPNSSAYMLCGFIPWMFITTATLDSSQSLLVYYGIIKKTYMPREVIPLAIVISNFIHFLMAWAVYFVAFLLVLPFFHKGIPLLTTIWAFPIITLVAALLVTGMALWSSALNVFYDDVKFVLQTLFQLLLFLLPILYPADKFFYLPISQKYPWLYTLYMLNPVTAIVDAYRKTILLPVPRGSFNLNGEPLMMNWGAFSASALITLLFALSGYWYFNYRKWQFVERP